MKTTDGSKFDTDVLSPKVDKLLETSIPEYKAIYDGMKIPMTAIGKGPWCDTSVVTYNALTKQLTLSVDMGTDVNFDGSTGSFTQSESLEDSPDVFAKTYSLHTTDRTLGCTKAVILEKDQYKYIIATVTPTHVNLEYTKPSNILNVNTIIVPMHTIQYKVKGTDTTIPNMTTVSSEVDNNVLKSLTSNNHLEVDIYVDGIKLPIGISLPVDNRAIGVSTVLSDVIVGTDIFYNIVSSAGATDEFTHYTYFLDGQLYTEANFKLTTELTGKVFTTLLSENAITTQQLSDVNITVYRTKEDQVIRSSNKLQYYVSQGYYSLVGTTLSGDNKSVDLLLPSFSSYVEDISNYKPLEVKSEENRELLSLSSLGIQVSGDGATLTVGGKEFPTTKLGFKETIFTDPATKVSIHSKGDLDNLFSATAPNNDIDVNIETFRISPINGNSSGLIKTQLKTTSNKIISIDSTISFSGNSNLGGRASILIYDSQDVLLLEIGFKRNTDNTTTLFRNGTSKIINTESYSTSDVVILSNIPKAAKVGIMVENNSTDVFSITDLIITTKEATW